MTNFVFEMRQTELLFSSDLNVYFNINMDWAVVAHAFNPSNWRQRQADLCEFETSLVYRVSSKTGSKATQSPCLKNQQTKWRSWVGIVLP